MNRIACSLLMVLATGCATEKSDRFANVVPDTQAVEAPRQTTLPRTEPQKKPVVESATDQAARLEYSKRPDVPAPIRNAVADKQVVLGMGTNQVKISWGEPKSISRSTGVSGTFETWTYSDRNAVLFFSNGLLEHITQAQTN